MPLIKAIRKLWKEWLVGERTASGSRRDESATFPRLYGFRLEERQLLDAAPLVQLTAGGMLTVTAGQAADDGQADQFSITETTDSSGSRIDVRVNGESAGTFAKSEVTRIRVVGSSDADSLVVDPLAAPAEGIVFEGAGTANGAVDQLILQSSAQAPSVPFESIHYTIGQSEGLADLYATNSLVTHVEYVGVEQVSDQLLADHRQFDLNADVAAQLFASNSPAGSQLVTNTGTTIDFNNPSQTLAISAQSSSPFASDSGNARLRVEGELDLTGGKISLDAGDGGLLEISGNLSTADSREGMHGGSIDLLGERVYVRTGSTIDASGAAGGGEIHVGGGQGGQDGSLRNSQYTWLEQGARLTADARVLGNGGRIIVWADQMTAVHGDISVRGGMLGGDGGFVETSGVIDLVVVNAPNLSAPAGNGGTWLIDPRDLTIAAVASSIGVTTTPPFSATADNAQLSIATLRAALQSGASVIIDTGTTGTQTGNITLATDLDLNGLNGGTLTLNAAGNIILNARIFDSDTNSVDRVNLVFNASSDLVGGETIQLNNATLNSGGGTITFSDAVIVGANVTIDSTTALGAGGTILFSGSVNADNSTTNDRTLAILAGAANVTFSSEIGTTNSFADLDVQAGTIRLTGNVTANDGGAAEVLFAGNVVLASNVAIDTDSSAGANDLRVTGTIAGDSGFTRQLSILASGADVAIDGNVNNLGLFRIRSARDVSLSEVVTGGTSSGVANTIHIGADSAVNSILLRGDLRTNGNTSGNTSGIRLNSNNAILLDAAGAGAIHLNTDGATLTDGDIVFATSKVVRSVTAGEDGLALRPGANNLNLSDFTFDSLDHLIVTTNSTNTVTLGGMTLADGSANSNTALSITTGTTNLTGNITAAGDVTFSGTVVLQANIINIDTHAATSSGDVTFSGLVHADNANANSRELEVDAGNYDVLFRNNIGVTGTTTNGALADLDVTARTITLQGATVRVDDRATGTVDPATLTGDVILANSVTFDLDGSSTNDNSLTITGSINADDRSTADRTLTINADSGFVILNAAIGQDPNGALADLDITAARINLGDNIRVNDTDAATAAEEISFTGEVFLTNDVAISVDAAAGLDNELSFTQQVKGDSIANARQLKIAAGNGDVTFANAISDLASFEVESADSLSLQGVTTAGNSKTYTIDLGSTSNLGSVTLQGDLKTDGATDSGGIRIQSDGNVTLNAAGASAGSIVFDTNSAGIDGDIVVITSASVTSSPANNDGWTLAVGTGSADLRSANLLDLDHLTITANTGGAVALGRATLDDGDFTSGVALSVTGGTVELTDAISTRSGKVFLRSNVILGGTASLDTTLTSPGADVEITGSIDADDSTAANRTLSIDAGAATLTLRDDIGTGVDGALAGLSLTAATITLEGSTIVLDDTDAPSSTILFAGAVVLGNSVVIDADDGGSLAHVIQFTGDIQADSETNSRSLAINAGSGSVDFQSEIGTGNNQSLADLDVTANSITLGGDVTIHAAGGGEITFTGPVLLAADILIDTQFNGTSGYDVRFTSTIDNATSTKRSLQVVAGDGTVMFEGVAGGGVNGKLADFDIAAAHIHLSDDILVDGGLSDGVLFDGAVQLNGNVTVDSTAAGGTAAAITFDSSIDADVSSNARTLALRATGGQVNLNGVVGGTVALADFDVTAATIALLENITVDASGGSELTFDGAVQLRKDLAIDTDGAAGDNSVVFVRTVDSQLASAPHSLSINAGLGTVEFRGAVGGIQALTDLDVTANSIILGADLKIDAGASNEINFNGDVRLDGNIRIDTDRASGADNSVVFAGRVDADSAAGNDRSLTVEAGLAKVKFQNDVGGALDGALSFLDVTAGSIELTSRVIADDGGGNTTAFRGTVILKGPVSIDVDKNTPGADNNLLFDDIVRADDSSLNDRQLTITADSGAVDFNASIGSGTNGQLANLDVTATSIRLGGSITVDDGPGGLFAALRGNVILSSNVTIDTAGTGVSNNIRVTGTITPDSAANNRHLILVAGGGNIRLDGAVSQLALFQIDSANNVELSGVQTRGRTNPTSINLGNVTSLGSLTLRGDLATDGATDAGDIRIQTTGAITLDAPGAGTIVLDTDAAGIDGGVTVVGGASFVSQTSYEDGLTLRLGSRDVDLRATSISTLDHLIVVTDGAHDVFLGSLSLGDGAGSGGQGSLSVTARTAVLSGNINSTSDLSQQAGDIEFNSAIQLDADIQIITQAPGGSGDVTIRGATRSNDANAFDRSFRIQADGATVSLNDVGDLANSALADLVIAADTIQLTGSSIRVDDANALVRRIDFQPGDVVLQNDVDITLGANSQPLDLVNFGGRVDADGVADRKLSVSAGSGRIVFANSIGSQPDGALAELDSTAQTIRFQGATVNLSDGTNRTSTLTGTIELANNVHFTTDGTSPTDNTLVFNGLVRADNASLQDRSLTVTAGNGSVFFEQDVGTGLNGALTGLTLTASTLVFRGSNVLIDDGAVASTNVWTGTVIVANDSLTIDTDATNVDKSLTINGNINADDASSAARTLTIQAGAAQVSLNGNVGVNPNDALADLDITASLIRLGGTLLRVNDATNGAMVTFAGAVRLDNNVSILTDSAGIDNGVDFLSSVDADNASTQNRQLSIDAGTALVRFNGDVGAASNGALAELDVIAGILHIGANLLRIDAAGNRESNWTGTVRLASNLVTIDLDGTAPLDNRLVVNGPIIADDSVNFDRQLAIFGGNGTVSLLGGVGASGGGELAGLTVEAGLYRLGGLFLIDDGGNRSIEFRGDGELASNVVFDIDGATDNSLTFFGVTSSLDSDSAAAPRQLTIIADQGSVVFQTALGDNSPLGGLNIVSAQNVTLARVTTSGNVGGNTINIGSASAISGQLALTGDLQTNRGTAAGGIRLNASGAVLLQAAGAGTSGSIRLDTDLDGSTADGIITFVGGANFRSAIAYEDGLTLSAGSQDVDLASATLAELDHLVVRNAGDRVVTLGSISVGDGSGSGAGAAIAVTSGVTRLLGDLNANNEANGGNVILQSAVELRGAIEIATDTGGGDGRVEIAGDVLADNQTAFDRTLTVNAGSSEAWFKGNIGDGNQGALANLQVTASTIRLAGANVIVNDATTGVTVLMAGAVQLENNVTLITDAVTGIDNDVSFAGSVSADDATANDRKLTIEAGAASVLFGGAVGVGGALADLDVAAAETRLSGNLLLDDQGGNTITFQGAVKLLRSISIDVDGSPDNHLLFVGPSSTIDGDVAANARNLSIVADQGNITFGGAIGSTERIGSLTITSVADLLAEGAIRATEVNQVDGSGNTTIRGAVDTTDSNGVQFKTDGFIDLQNDVTTAGSGVVRLTQGTGLGLGGNVLADGGFLENGSGLVTLNAGRFVGTTGDSIEFTNDIRLAGGGGILRLDSTRGGQSTGNDITLRGRIDGTTASPNSESLTLIAGTQGDILVEGPIGSVAPIGVLRIDSGANMTFVDEVIVAGLLLPNGQAGTTISFRSDVTTNSNLGLLISTLGDIQFDGSLHNTGGGQLNVINGGTLTIGGDIDSNGLVRQQGAGATNFVGPRTISTTGQIVDWEGPITLVNGRARGSSLTVETLGGEITLSSTIDSPDAGDLTLDAGATGNITLAGNLGAIAPLGEVAIRSAQQLHVQANVVAESFQQIAGSGNTLLSGEIQTSGGGGITVTTAGDISVNRMTAQGNVPLRLKSGRDIVVGPNGEVFLTGNSPLNELVLDAQNNLAIAPSARLRVGTGTNQAVASGVTPIITVSPVTNPYGVNVSEQGETTVRVQIGTASSEEQNVNLRIIWEEGQFSPIPGTVSDPDFVGGGRVYTFNYQYNGNPGKDPTDPIPIQVIAAFDERIVLGSQGSRLGVTVQERFLQPPNGGLFGFNVIIPTETALPRIEPARPIPLTIVPPPMQLPIAQRFDPGSSPTATTVERTREIQLRVVTLNSQGEPEDSDEFIALDEGELNNLPELFQSLPDNRYRIYLRTENGSRRLIRDVVIRNRKVVELDSSVLETVTEPQDPREASPKGAAPHAEQNQTSRNSQGENREGSTLEQDGAGRSRAMSAALVSAGAVLMSVPGRNSSTWNDRARRAMRASLTRPHVRHDSSGSHN